MRVISGKYKNKKILTLKELSTRPTISRVREDIFNILQNYFIYENKIVVDLFAGTGVLGIEFLSRGAKYCFFNDNNKLAYSIIEKNLKSLNEKNYNIHMLDYIIFLNFFKSLNTKMDALILDPPFDEHTFYYKVFDYIFKFNLLNNYGIIIVESDFELDLSNYMKYDDLDLLKHKKYNYRNLYILRRRNDSNDG